MNRKVLVAGALLLALAAGVAVVFTLGDGSDPGLDLSEIPTPIVTGSPLPPLPDAPPDPAEGMPAPEATGVDFALNPVEIVDDGQPKVILFLAHHCPHCQTEVPRVQAWLDTGGKPGGVGFYSVATSIDELRPNYPPDAWLEREGWTVPVLVDTDNSVAQAYGLTAFPFWVFVDGGGQVLGRVAGELPQEALSDLFSLTLP